MEKDSFLDYFNSYALKIAGKKTSRMHVYELFCEFQNYRVMSFEQLTPKLCTEFLAHLLRVKSKREPSKTLSEGTVACYYSIFKAVLHEAFVDGFLEEDIGRKVKAYTAPKQIREILEDEELKRLANTPCSSTVIQRAAFFTLLTGLKHADVLSLTWKEIVKDDDGWQIMFAQKKAGRPDVVPLSSQAYTLCGKRQSGYLFVFQNLPDVTTCNRNIEKWLKVAGIERPLTYMCFRHTFAVRLLRNGVDIVVVQMLMGHTRATTTERYVQIVSKFKRMAADSVTI